MKSGVNVPEFLTMREAVGKYVHDGDTVYLAGFTHLIPFAIAHEIIRQGRRHLTLCRMTPDLVYDQMLAAGVADRLIFSYAGNPGLGNLHAFRRLVEEGAVAIEEYTHFELVARLAAGAAGVPFWPLRSLPNDLTRGRPRPSVEDPFGGGEVPVVRALVPDVTLLHAHAADEAGNVYARGLLGEVKEAAFAAGRVVVSVEEVVSERWLREDRDHLLIPGFRVDAVVACPFGAHPSYALGRYDRDTAFYLEWDDISRAADRTRAWLDRHIYGTADHEGYLALLPAGRLADLEEAARRG